MSTTRAWQLLESRFGRIADLVKPKPVLTASSLETGHLRAVSRSY
jgi:hypothetical protein